MPKIELIKASAGSGKTTRLMELLSEYIAAGIRPEGLLATTFTVKAAAELKSRIRQKLLDGPKPELASQVFDGLIGTVNGVCGRLLNEYAVEAGLSPALDVLPEENADAIFGAATSAVMGKYAEKLEPVAARLSMNPVGNDKYAGDWKSDVRTILNLARSNNLGINELKTCAERAVEALKEIFPASESLSLEEIETLVAPCRNFPANAQTTQDTVNKIRSFLRSPTWAGAASLANAKYAVRDDEGFPIDIFHGIRDRLIYSQELHADMCAMIRGVFACAGESLEAYARYKKDFGLVDFVDQECGVLALLENNPHFVQLMKERLSRIMVDEFQDTSPIQLALFLKLNECSRNGSVWVGDPKQAIYGFRGTDPELMAAVASTIPEYKTLEYSYRSRKTLVDLANEIFTRAFSTMDPKDVALGIPPDRKEKAVGGSVEAWHLNGRNKDHYMQALAAGIADLIRTRGVTPNQICVLLRSNEDCAALAGALATWNIPASAPSGSLLATAECQLVMAAFRYCVDRHDTVALATLLALYGETPDWLEKLHRAKTDWLGRSEEERKQTDFAAELRNTGFLKALEKKADATPMEILEHVITALDLDGKVSAMSYPDRRMSNIEELRRRCAEYMKQALLDRRAATPAGFVAALNAADAGQAAGFGPNTVNVMTYHKAKGLAWPIVILASLDADNKGGAFGIRAGQSAPFDAEHPLNGRTIHYWPWPFGKVQNNAPLEEALDGNRLQTDAIKREREEMKRVFYVGFTRARDEVIFAFASKPPTTTELKRNPDAPNRLLIRWLDSLSDVPLLTFPAEEGPGELTVGTAHFPITTRSFSADAEIVPLPSPAVFADARRDLSGVPTFPARLSPSGASCGNGKAKLLCQWNYRNAVRCKEGKYNLLGNAFHSFIALNPQQERTGIAARLLKNWTVEDAAAPETLAECADNLYRWIADTYPGAKIGCEVPMTCHDENGTLYQGFIDMLLELPDGSYVIIDHKTHPAEFDAEAYAASCAGQLRIYRQAVEEATGKPVRQTVIHLPNLGRCFLVE